MSERESCHLEGCSGYGRVRADDTSAAPPPGASPPRPDSPGGEAAVSRPPDGDAHAPFWFSTKSSMPPARRTGPRNVLAFEMVISAFCTAGPYRGGQRRRFVAPPTRISSLRRCRCPAWCRTRAACLLQYPASSQKSSNTSDFLVFLVFPAFRYACALIIVSSIPAALFSSKGSAVFCHPSRPFSHEFTEPIHLHFG